MWSAIGPLFRESGAGKCPKSQRSTTHLTTIEKNTCSDFTLHNLARFVATFPRTPIGGVGGLAKNAQHRQQEGLAVLAVLAVLSVLDSSLESNTLRVSSRNGTYYLKGGGKGAGYAYIRRNRSLPESRSKITEAWLFGTFNFHPTRTTFPAKLRLATTAIQL